MPHGGYHGVVKVGDKIVQQGSPAGAPVGQGGQYNPDGYATEMAGSSAPSQSDLQIVQNQAQNIKNIQKQFANIDDNRSKFLAHQTPQRLLNEAQNRRILNRRRAEVLDALKLGKNVDRSLFTGRKPKEGTKSSILNAFGIGTSQVAQVLASQCLLLNKPKKMRVNVNGKLNKNVTPKDVILYIISKLGTDGGTGYFVEYSGNIFSEMSMEGRMTVCNMSIEMGARGGMIAPDKVTYEYLEGKPYAPKGNLFNIKVDEWEHLKSDSDAEFDKEYFFEAEEIYPMLTYGTNPGMGIKYSDLIPKSDNKSDIKSLEYMGFKSGESLIGKKINYVFIGSCTNSRIEDFRIVAEYIKDKKKAKNVNALIVPGSQNVLNEIRKEGLDKIFMSSGFEIRQPGCSACLAMNDDKIPPGEICVSTSNRNFEGRQGPGSRTILSSPLMAAATAVNGKIIDINE